MIAKLKENLKSSLGLFEHGPLLRNRLLFIIVGASLIIVLVTAWLSLRYQREQLIKTTRATNVTLSNAILANLKHAMLTVDWEMMNEAVQDVAAEDVIESLRILNDQGLIFVSSQEEEVGTSFRQDEALCRSCHINSTAQRSNHVEFLRQDGSQVLIHVNLIQNQPECYGCHLPENQVLGLMMIETSLNPVTEELNMGFWRTLLVALIAFLLLIGLIVPGLNHIILRPIDELSEGVAQISSGNLDYRVPIASQDELGKLAGSFDHMREQLKITRAGMKLREQELATLNEVGLAATQMLDVGEILTLAMDTMVGKLGMAEAVVYLWDDALGRYTPQAYRGISQAQIEEIDRRRRSGQDITLEVAETGEEVFVPDMVEDLRFQGVWDELENRSYVKLPLKSRGTVVGVLGVVSPVGQVLTVHDVEFLKVVGREIGIAIDNARLLADTREREKQAVTLYKLGTDISASLALDDVLVAVAKAARDLMTADIGLVGLVNPELQEVMIKAVAGTRTSLIFRKPIPMSDQSPWDELREGRCFISDKDQLEYGNLHTEDLVTREEINSLLVVPLRRGGQFLGIIEVLTRTPRKFQPRDGRLLLRLANQVVVAIENAQLYQQLHHLVALEERDRLARELHDHLAQGLGYLKVKASITEELLSNRKIEQSLESLLELKKVTQTLYTDVREEIFNLRTAVPERMDFFATLQEYLANYQTHYGLNANILVERECPSEFAPEVAGQLLRIIQEALTNVRRHSNAGKVLIHCMSGGEQVCISIEDDGQGFYPTRVSTDEGQRYGLQIMRERAESVGGSLELDSQPGEGTRVVVRIPAI